VAAQVCSALFASEWMRACSCGETLRTSVQRNAPDKSATTKARSRFIEDAPEFIATRNVLSLRGLRKRIVAPFLPQRFVPGNELRPSLSIVHVIVLPAGQDQSVGLLNGRMFGPARIYFIIFGVLTIAGGIIGYVKASSTPSIIAGSITGILLLIGAWLLPEHAVAGLLTILIVSLILAAQFVPKFIKTGKAMPAGMMSILSVIGIIVAIVAWVRK
jgi:uncharacterized membrane protein (UPF0136 family)